MSIKGCVVHSKAFGEGVIVSYEPRDATIGDSSYIKVQFATRSEPVTLVLPGAFDKALTSEAPKVLTLVRETREALAGYETAKAARRREEPVRVVPHSDWTNLAIKCTFCDGGASELEIGYHGVCSSKMIRTNVKVLKRAWCSSVDCPCSHCVKGEVSREELVEDYRQGGFVCYESAMLRDWKVGAGADAKGTPKRILNASHNSLCVLSAVEPGMPEKDRYVFAFFVIDEIYEGSDGQAERMDDWGFVAANKSPRVALPPSVAQQLKFWDYHANENKPSSAFWGSGLFRYVSDLASMQMLMKAQELLGKGEGAKELAEVIQAFANYTKLDPANLPPAAGALTLQ